MKTAKRVVVAAGIGIVLAACVGDETTVTIEVPDEAITEEEAGDVVTIAYTTMRTVTAGYTPWTSEEYSPIGSDPPGLMVNLSCSGSYCDNIRAYVSQPSSWDTGAPMPITYGYSYWTPYFSEEHTRQWWQECADGYWVTGLDCDGRYCDNISLRCTHIANTQRVDCGWSPKVYSGSSPDTPWGSVAIAGVLCSGSYCSQMQMLQCTMR